MVALGFEALSSLMMAGTTFASSLNQAQSARMQGDFAKKQSDMNAMLAERQAADAIRRGAGQAAGQQRKARALVGEQRVAQAANGNDVNSGSAAQLQSDSTLMGALDAITLQNNAYREAYGYQVQSDQSRLQGRLSQIAGDASATNSLIQGTLLTGAYGVRAYSQARQPRIGDQWGGGGFRGPGSFQHLQPPVLGGSYRPTSFWSND